MGVRIRSVQPAVSICVEGVGPCASVVADNMESKDKGKYGVRCHLRGEAMMDVYVKQNLQIMKKEKPGEKEEVATL